jgi:hypothetical protein
MFACMFLVIGSVDFAPTSLASAGSWDLDQWISLVMFILGGLCLAAALITGPHLKA